MKNDGKNDFRISSIKRLKFQSLFLKYYKNKIIVQKLEKLIYKKDINNILVYNPLEMEVDIRPLINKLRKKNKNVYIPFMRGESFKIVKYRLPLQKKKFGIKEPNNSFLTPRKLDVAIIPVVGVDAVFKRIGFGKGMYDRFFCNLGYAPTMIFTQLILCKSSEILTNDYDIQADYIITG